MAGNAKKIRKGYYHPKCPDVKNCHIDRGKHKVCSECEPGIWIFIPKNKAVVIVDENQVFGHGLRNKRPEEIIQNQEANEKAED
jgi:hypothetical protein